MRGKPIPFSPRKGRGEAEATAPRTRAAGVAPGKAADPWLRRAIVIMVLGAVPTLAAVWLGARLSQESAEWADAQRRAPAVMAERLAFVADFKGFFDELTLTIPNEFRVQIVSCKDAKERYERMARGRATAGCARDESRPIFSRHGLAVSV